MSIVKKIPQNEDETQFAQIAPSLYRMIGERFTRRSLTDALDVLMSELGRTDRNYGSWVEENEKDEGHTERPIRIVCRSVQGRNSDTDVMEITTSWLEHLGTFAADEIDEVTARLNIESYINTGGVETFNEYMARKLADD